MRIGKWGGLGFGIALGSTWTAQGMDFNRPHLLAALPCILIGIATCIGLMLTSCKEQR